MTRTSARTCPPPAWTRSWNAPRVLSLQHSWPQCRYVCLSVCLVFSGFLTIQRQNTSTEICSNDFWDRLKPDKTPLPDSVTGLQDSLSPRASRPGIARCSLRSQTFTCPFSFLLLVIAWQILMVECHGVKSQSDISFYFGPPLFTSWMMKCIAVNRIIKFLTMINFWK